MNNPFLVGKRLYLRPVEPSDGRLLAECNNDPAVRVSFFTHTPTSIHLQSEKAADLYRPGADYLPFVICVVEDDQPIGITALHRVDLVSHAAVYSICISDSGKWGRGYAGEVTGLMLKYCFDVLNLHRVQLHVWAENSAGVHVYEKAGFVREGCLREAMRHDGKYYDFLVMGILDREWRAAQFDSPTDGKQGPDTGKLVP